MYLKSRQTLPDYLFNKETKKKVLFWVEDKYQAPRFDHNNIFNETLKTFIMA